MKDLCFINYILQVALKRKKEQEDKWTSVLYLSLAKASFIHHSNSKVVGFFEKGIRIGVFSNHP